MFEWKEIMENFELIIKNIPIITENMEQNKQEVERIKKEHSGKKITVTTSVISVVTVVEERTI